MRLITWNIGRRPPDSAASKLMISRIAEEDPSVVCLTHAFSGSAADLGGHVIADRGADWGFEEEGEQKVVLQSRAPWTDEIPLAALSALGGAVSGVTETDLGPVRFVGICTPHHFASPGGELPRPPLWSLHIQYLEALQAALKDMDSSMPIIVVGDFNQYVPLVWGDWGAHHALNKALHGFHIATDGSIPDIQEASTSHVALPRDFRLRKVKGLSRFDADGSATSDHFGIVTDIDASGVAIFD